MNHSVHWLVGILTLASIQPLKDSSRASLPPGERPVASVSGVTTAPEALNSPAQPESLSAASGLSAALDDSLADAPGNQALADDIRPGASAFVSTEATNAELARARDELADLQARYDALEVERNALLGELAKRPAPATVAVKAAPKAVPVSYNSNACYGGNCNTGRRRLFGRR